jgi:ribosomal protein L15
MVSRTNKFRGSRYHGRGKKAGRGAGKRGGRGICQATGVCMDLIAILV